MSNKPKIFKYIFITLEQRVATNELKKLFFTVLNGVEKQNETENKRKYQATTAEFVKNYGVEEQGLHETVNNANNSQEEIRRYYKNYI